MTDTAAKGAAPLEPKPCPKCGEPALVVKSGSRRFWVQCSHYPDNGNCSAIGAMADNRKQAIMNWNSNRR
jgi:ssDNA-binding Zn-finger/Zn-ribbon topoisomerase 1